MRAVAGSSKERLTLKVSHKISVGISLGIAAMADTSGKV
jgi:hypothetical protein